MEPNSLQPISALIKQDIRHKNVVINLWSDKHRSRDIVGGIQVMCGHMFVSSHRCDSCGAYIGFMGTEHDPLTYYKHIDLLSNSFTNSDNVYVVTDRPYPEDYQLPSFNMNLIDYKAFKYKRVYTLYSKVNSGKRGTNTKARYVIHYTNDPAFLWKNKIVHTPTLDPLLLIESSDTLLVNPTPKDFKYYHSQFTFFIPNSSIMVLVKDSHIRDSINLLKV